MATKQTPTDQQIHIMDLAATRQSLVIRAGAGTGKSTTLRMICEWAQTLNLRVLYLAFNKSVQVEAQKTFPKNTICKTNSALAWGPVIGSNPALKARLNKGERVPAWKAAGILGVRRGLQIGDKALDSSQVTRLALETVENFCKSADEAVSLRHVPVQEGLEDAHEQVQHAVLPIALKAWADISSDHGSLKFSHSHYLKMFQLQHPKLAYDIIMLDEAQDANPVMADILLNQDCQLIMVGDECQAIYGFTGAINAMADFAKIPGVALGTLSESFRFGPEIAAAANKWLTLMDAPLRLTGRAAAGTVAPIATPDAILCRTNAGCLTEAMRQLASGRKTAIAGGTNDLKWLAESAIALQAGRKATHASLVAFRNWAEVLDYVENDSTATDIKAFVQLVEKIGAEVILETVAKLVSEKGSFDVIVSTAHKAKGSEWERVQIGADFPQPTDKSGKPVPPNPNLVKLIYVAVTRAKRELDATTLAWAADLV